MRRVSFLLRVSEAVVPGVLRKIVLKSFAKFTLQSGCQSESLFNKHNPSEQTLSQNQQKDIH